MKDNQALLNHEALDRSYIVLEQLENLLGEHPVIQNDDANKALYDSAFKSLYTLYQKLGTES